MNFKRSIYFHVWWEITIFPREMKIFQKTFNFCFQLSFTDLFTLYLKKPGWVVSSTVLWSMSVSVQLHIYPSPKPTLTLTCYLLIVVWLQRGWWIFLYSLANAMAAQVVQSFLSCFKVFVLVFLFKQNPFANSTYAIEGYPVKLFITVKENVVVHHGFKNEQMFYHLSHDVGVRPSQLCIDGSWKVTINTWLISLTFTSQDHWLNNHLHSLL